MRVIVGDSHYVHPATKSIPHYPLIHVNLIHSFIKIKNVLVLVKHLPQLKLFNVVSVEKISPEIITKSSMRLNVDKSTLRCHSLIQ
jgi:hypothetical protein